MRVAFHTPLKPIDHPIPSGDRAMARELVALLRDLDCQVWLAARYRPGIAVLPPSSTQLEQQRRGRNRARRIVARWRSLPFHHPERFELWVTYHLYYKKPDWVGPLVAQSLGIPYVVIEASHAPKRRFTSWRVGHRAVELALRQADLVLTLNPNDEACVRPLLRAPSRQQPLPPFLDTAPYVAARDGRETHRARLGAEFALDLTTPWLLSVAMMRKGDKLSSFRLLAAALSQIANLQWQLIVVGDGECRSEVETLLAPLRERVRFLGALPPQALPAIYAAADLYVWPAINEAYGMTLLEAQASGLAVIAGRTGGVPAIVRDGASGVLVPVGDAVALAAALARLLTSPQELARLRAGASVYVAARHTRMAVGRRLRLLLRSVMSGLRNSPSLP